MCVINRIQQHNHPQHLPFKFIFFNQCSVQYTTCYVCDLVSDADNDNFYNNSNDDDNDDDGNDNNAFILKTPFRALKDTTHNNNSTSKKNQETFQCNYEKINK